MSHIKEIHCAKLTLEDLETIKNGGVVEKLMWKDEFENGDIEESIVRVALKGHQFRDDPPKR